VRDGWFLRGRPQCLAGAGEAYKRRICAVDSGTPWVVIRRLVARAPSRHRSSTGCVSVTVAVAGIVLANDVRAPCSRFEASDSRVSVKFQLINIRGPRSRSINVRENAFAIRPERPEVCLGDLVSGARPARLSLAVQAPAGHTPPRRRRKDGFFAVPGSAERTFCQPRTPLILPTDRRTCASGLHSAWRS
jgi:hypothetical protein